MVDFAGQTPGKVIQSTSFESKMPGDPWRSLWLCQDQGVIPVGFPGAVQPCHQLTVASLQWPAQ